MRSSISTIANITLSNRPSLSSGASTTLSLGHNASMVETLVLPGTVDDEIIYADWQLHPASTSSTVSVDVSPTPPPSPQLPGIPLPLSSDTVVSYSFFYGIVVLVLNDFALPRTVNYKNIQHLPFGHFPKFPLPSNVYIFFQDKIILIFSSFYALFSYQISHPGPRTWYPHSF